MVPYKFNVEVIKQKYEMDTVLLAPPHIVEVDDAFIEWERTEERMLGEEKTTELQQ